jgi:propanol-preferring alcohol dehydrogenase
MVAGRLAGGDTALVIGAGGLGQMAVQFLKLLTPARVVVADIAAAKRDAALALGADVVVDPAAGDAADQVREATAGQGAAACLDVVGSDASLAFGAASLGFKGHLVIVGLAGGGVPLHFFGFPPEVVLTTSHWGTHNELEEVVALARQGRLQIDIERAPLEAINDVFGRLERGEIAGRAVLVP